MFSCHVSIAHFLSRQYILSTFSGKVSPDGNSSLGRSLAWRGCRELCRAIEEWLLLRIQRKGPTAQPGQDEQGQRFGIRFEPVLGSRRPKPWRFSRQEPGQAALPVLGSSPDAVCRWPDPTHSQIKQDFWRWRRHQPLPDWQTPLTSPQHQFYSRAFLFSCKFICIRLYIASANKFHVLPKSHLI